ncbi:nitroreductase family deazaflavin-dependent oxidoreductase [Glaciibacter superstes]|uniref:nitroreductase family deazaflavin-dependent oxidoreductase n=1 Tax=Glaciibacter superstes TaxID=501023 RepID=UPI0003B705A7|nr:nitroreductase family deazaflavin-dependent oxidoreductase [Glaciibacter superstes]
MAWYLRAALARAMLSRPARRIGPAFIPGLHLRLFHLTRGRFELSRLVVPSLVLYTVGARTGARRETPLLCCPEPGGTLLVADSNFGRDFHPGWSANLLAHPHAQISRRGHRRAVTAELLEGPQRELAWTRLEGIWPGYREYERTANRQFRVFRLTLVTETTDASSLPNLTGRRIVVTGGSSGLGYFVTEKLAAAGASVVIAARDPGRAATAARSVRDRVPGAHVTIVQLDLADLESVARAAAELEGTRIDALVANAGLLPQRRRGTTADGFELVFGTNHLGHFALIGRLLPTLLATEGSRIVHLGSVSHRRARLDFDDLMSRRYRPYRTYRRSKLAVMLFAFELDRRLHAAFAHRPGAHRPATQRRGTQTRSLVADPGYATDALSPARDGIVPPANRLFRFAVQFIGQGKDVGVSPIVHAVCQGTGGQYWATSGRLRGRAVLAHPDAGALDERAARRLWDESERLTGVTFDALD